ncbi:MAG TPA: response regulator [Clostridia bacterium]|nr:response regulator [Clostridia bacterium]
MRVLFVDDEPNIRLTLPAILKMHGFDVTARATVAEALATMHAEKFDVLIADLNIGQPGDGFTVVSAMRRTQPHAVTIILTGYPAFETALEAIRNQVDDYVVKPANVPQLLNVIEEKLKNHTPSHHLPVKRVSSIVRENRQGIFDLWLDACLQSVELASAQLSEAERLDHLPAVVEELAAMLDSHPGAVSQTAISAAEQHGLARRAQGYTIPMMLLEVRILRCAIYRTLQQNLLALEISYVISDMIHISDSLDQQLRRSCEAYIRGSVEPTTPGQGRSGPGPMQTQ